MVFEVVVLLMEGCGGLTWGCGQIAVVVEAEVLGANFERLGEGGFVEDRLVWRIEFVVGAVKLETPPSSGTKVLTFKASSGRIKWPHQVALNHTAPRRSMSVEETPRQPLPSGRGMDGSTEIHNFLVPRPASMATIEQGSRGG